MPLDDFLPPIIEAVKNAVPVPVYEYLVDQIFEIPAVLFEPPVAKGQWPRGSGGWQDWEWTVKISCLFARSGESVAVADQQARELIEPIRAALWPLTRPGWPPVRPAIPDNASEVNFAGMENIAEQTLEWGGVLYLALTLNWRVVERYYDTRSIHTT